MPTNFGPCPRISGLPTNFWPCPRISDLAHEFQTRCQKTPILLIVATHSSTAPANDCNQHPNAETACTIRLEGGPTVVWSLQVLTAKILQLPRFRFRYYLANICSQGKTRECVLTGACLEFFLKSRKKYHGNKKQETNPCEIGRTSWDGFVHHLQTPSTPCMRLTHNATQPHRKASVLDTYCSLNCVSALIEGLTCCESLNV